MHVHSTEISLPNEQSRLEILKIHAIPIAKRGDIDYESVVKLTDGFNGADLRNVCTEAGLFAIRDEREWVIEEDMMKAARKVRCLYTCGCDESAHCVGRSYTPWPCSLAHACVSARSVVWSVCLLFLAGDSSAAQHIFHTPFSH